MFSFNRLDVKAQTVDKGYPRNTDDDFAGVPSDSHDIFVYKGKDQYENIVRNV